MNCLEFRRQILEDPSQQTAEQAAHSDSCHDCARYAEEIIGQEALLKDTLFDFEPPAELADNIQLAIQLDKAPKQRWRTAAYAVAASVMIVVGATVTSLVNESWERSNMALAQSVLDHIEDESGHLHSTDQPQNARAQLVMARFGARLNTDIGPIQFAAECLMRNRNGVHLILKGEQGLITVFLMPGEQTEQAQTIASADLQGTILPTAWGSIAVVGEANEPVDALAEQLATHVSWGSANSGLVNRSRLDPRWIAQH